MHYLATFSNIRVLILTKSYLILLVTMNKMNMIKKSLNCNTITNPTGSVNMPDLHKLQLES